MTCDKVNIGGANNSALGNTRRRTWATTKECSSRLLITVHIPELVGGRDGVSRRTIVPT